MFQHHTLISAFGLALIATGADAQPNAPDFGPPMRLTIVRGDVTDCPSNCGPWISMEGAFVSETTALFRKALKQIRGAKPQLLINSGGGSVQAAMEMGRLLRARGLDVSVARTLFEAPAGATASTVGIADGGRPSARNSYCASACALLLAAGKARHVATDARVGLHEMVIPEQDVTQHVRYFQTRTLTRNGEVISKETRIVGEKDLVKHVQRRSTSARDYRKVAAYLEEMGLPSAKLVELMHGASPEAIVWLSRKSLADTLLATDAQPPEAALGFAPKAAPPAPQVAVSAPLRGTGPATARPSPENTGDSTSASQLGLTGGQLALAGVLTLAMLAAILISFLRGRRLRDAEQRRDPPPLS